MLVRLLIIICFFLEVFSGFAQGIYLDYSLTNTRCDASTGIVEITNIKTSPAPFEFSLDGLNYSTQQTFTNLSVGDTIIFIKDGFGNILQELISIDYLSDPLMELTLVNQFCEFEFGKIIVANVIDGEPPYTYFLDDVEVVGNELNEVPFGFHQIKVVDGNGCFRTQGAELINDCIVVSTGFSPNNDGINDLWTIQRIQNYPDNTVRVFNRYGQLVFKTEEYDNTWNGNSSGLTLPIGTYYYEVEVRIVSGESQIFTGSLVILK